MNETEAKKLTERIVGTWPSSPKGFVWTETLLDLDHTVALAAITKLTRTHDESRLTVARLLAEYNGLNTRRSHATPAHCQACDGSGLRTARQFIGGVDHGVVVACELCIAGRQHAESLRRADQANARENAGRRQAHAEIVDDDPPTDGPTISFDEYIARLVWRSGTGDPEAVEMLAVWERNLTRFGRPDTGAMFKQPAAVEEQW